jgi:DNA-binding GntR family transcriptional regulator
MDTFDLSDALGGSASRRLAARQPLVDDVHDVLVDMLMNHTLPPGARLNIDALARSLGVSPTPVREALARAEAAGLVVKERNRGYAVAALIGLDELHTLMDFRLLVEPHAAAQAAERVDDEEARNLLDYAHSGGSGADDPAASRLDMLYDAQFHDMIAALSGNPWLRESLSRLQSHLHMYRLYHHAGQAAATKPEHVKIAEAIAARDPEAARAAMTQHLRTAMNRIDEVFSSGRAGDAPAAR